jgi:hypothetical protein
MVMTLEQTLLKKATQAMSDDIDRGILKGMGMIFDLYGQEYLTVAPIMGSTDKWHDMVVWMNNTFGYSPDLREANARWYVDSGKFWFRDARDRDWFVLKWA